MNDTKTCPKCGGETDKEHELALTMWTPRYVKICCEECGKQLGHALMCVCAICDDCHEEKEEEAPK